MPTDDVQAHDRRSYDKWHIDRRINIGEICAIIALAVPFLIWGAKINERVMLVESQMQIVTKKIDHETTMIRQENIRNNQVLREDIREMRGSQDRLNDKLDKIIHLR